MVSIDRAVPDELSLARETLEQHIDPIARLEIGVEVDLATEHLRQPERKLHGLA